MAGLTTTGITIKNVDDVLSDVEADELANIDSQLNVGADDVLGQLNGIFSAKVAEAFWELLEEIYYSAYPDTASGQSLSYIAALTGAIRQEATKAELDVRLIGTVSTIVPAGTQIYVEDDPDSIFETTAPATIAEHGATDYVDVTVRALVEGSQTTASAGDTLVVGTPVAGLSSVTTTGATPFSTGLDEETDAQLRVRRESTLALGGASTVEAIRADMLTVAGVDSCTVFENPTSATDAITGLPPYSIEVLVHSSAAPHYTAQDIVDQIWLSKPAGTETYGSLSAVAVDSSGNNHTIEYSEPTTVRCYVTVGIELETDNSFPGVEAVQNAVADWCTLNLRVGDYLYQSDIVKVVAGIVGVKQVLSNSALVDDAYPPQLPKDLAAAPRQLITVQAADVGVYV